MGMIAKALDEQGVRYAGGAIMNASDWHHMRFDFDSEQFFRPHDQEQKIRWESIYCSYISKYKQSVTKPTIITDIGLQRGDLVSGLDIYLNQIHGNKAQHQITMAEFYSYVLMSRRNHIAVLCKFLAKGYSIIMVTEPPTDLTSDRAELKVKTDAFFSSFYRSIGCSVFNVRDWIKKPGGFPQRFFSTGMTSNQDGLYVDMIHGTPEYYRELSKEIFSEFSIEPQFRQANRPQE
jgi:hypothetical protein